MTGDALADALGVTHPPADDDARIVSLVPSITELLFHLGLGSRVVGRTTFCVHPEEAVSSVPRVGGTKELRIDKLRALHPSHVIVNIDENRKQDVEIIAGFTPHVIVTHPLNPDDNLALYRLLGGIFGRQSAARRLCEEFQRARDALIDAAAALPRRRVLYLIWRDPWMTISRDTYISQTLALANWLTVCHDPETRYPQVRPDPRLLTDTDMVLFSSEPFPFKPAHLKEFRRLTGDTDTAFEFIDGEMTSWYGNRAVTGLRYLHRLLGSVPDDGGGYTCCMRIVSLLPSASEIVCALGYSDQLVGRSHECDHPASVVGLPICSRPRIRVDTSSNEIDQSVKAIVSKGLSVYEIDEDTLRTLAPDFIVTQTQCDVCAVSERDVEQAVEDWLDGRGEIISLNPNHLEDVWTDIIRVATALGNRSNGEAVAAALRQRMSEIHERTAQLERKPRVALIEWIEPLMAAGNWMPTLVDMAGGQNLIGKAGEHSPWMTLEELERCEPDVIVVAACGFGLERTRSEMPPLTERPEWRALAAVSKGQVFLTDGHHFFNRPGPRLVESLEILAEILHPESIAPRHRGPAWMPL